MHSVKLSHTITRTTRLGKLSSQYEKSIKFDLEDYLHISPTVENHYQSNSDVPNIKFYVCMLSV